jgi:hypothetical protein
MLPTEMFSENVGPPWRPPVWQVGPDGLVREAQRDLWNTAARLHEVLNSSDELAMAGPGTADHNEYEQLIDSSQIPRSAAWDETTRGLFTDAPSPWKNGVPLPPA